jgi:hypothetical protein
MINLKKIFTPKINNAECNFGQYADLWPNHKDSCMRIIRITSNYIVYINKQNNIDWETKEDYDAKKTEQDKIESEKALSHCLIAERKPTGGLGNESILSFKIIVGEAIVNTTYLGKQTIIELTV